jgi:catechol 2,3-dioxygenase-like lactoylglutathione lyase family enzyme
VVLGKMVDMTESSAIDDATPLTAASSIGPSVVLDLVVLDTDEPRRLAEFYAALLGWEIVREEEDWVTVRAPSVAASGSDVGSVAAGPSIGLAFQLVINFSRPTWPTGAVPQQFHLDINVDDAVAAAQFAESLGASRAQGGDTQPGFTVFLDPSGHPFCLCTP